MNHQSTIRAHVLIPLTLTILVLVISSILTIFAVRRDSITTALSHEYGESISVFKAMLAAKTELMSTTAEPIMHDPALLQAMRRKDRTALYTAAQPYFKKLTGKKVTHFYFHDPQGTNFLRVHQPNQHSDSITRSSMRQAMETGAAAHGLELGPFGTLTLRLVIPWKDRTGQLGFIELGTEVNDTLNDLAILTNTDYLLVVNKTLLNKNAVPVGYAWVGKRLDWDQFPDKVVIAQSLEQIPHFLLHQLAQKDSNLFHDKDWQTAALGKKHFAFKTFSFRESSNQEIGNFILLYDITLQTRQFRHFIVRTVLISGVLDRKSVV